MAEGHQQHPEQGINSIQGAWVLDLSRSDTMRRYLQVCGVPEDHIRVHVDAERRQGGLNVIQVGDRNLTIYKHTFANNRTESYAVDEEIVRYDSRTRARTAQVLSFRNENQGFVRSANLTTTPGRHNTQLLETRQVEEGGLSHCQEVKIHNLTTGEDCVTIRFWRRITLTPEHWAALEQHRTV
ncbi:unnamed protein product [Ectocarpus fasciculatus]